MYVLHYKSNSLTKSFNKIEKIRGHFFAFGNDIFENFKIDF